MFQAVLAELAKRKGRLPEVCEAVPGIDYSWLSKLTQGRIKDPSVNKIQALYDFLFQIRRSADPAVDLQRVPGPAPVQEPANA